MINQQLHNHSQTFFVGFQIYVRIDKTFLYKILTVEGLQNCHVRNKIGTFHEKTIHYTYLAPLTR